MSEKVEAKLLCVENDSDWQKKIRDAELEKIPYMLIVGKKELESKGLSVRSKSKGDLGFIKIDEFIQRIKKEIEEKS